MLHVHAAIQRRVFLTMCFPRQIIFFIATTIPHFLDCRRCTQFYVSRRSDLLSTTTFGPKPNYGVQFTWAKRSRSRSDYSVGGLAASMGFELRRPEFQRSARQPPNYCGSEYGVPLSAPNPFGTSLLMPGVPIDSAVANAPGQRRAQPLPLAPPAAAHLPSPSPRPMWDHEDRDLLLKSANRPRFMESSGVRIRAFLADAENFLEMCGRPRDRWARFIISWLGANEAEKVRRSHFIADGVDYDSFKNGLITLFGRLESEDSYRQQLRELIQAGSESVADSPRG